MKHNDKLLTLNEVAERYSLSLSTLRRWSSERKFPLYKISNRIRVSNTEFRDLLNKIRVWNTYYNNLEHCGLSGLTPNEFLADYKLIKPPNVLA